MESECAGLQFSRSRHLVNYPMEFHSHGPGVVNISVKDLGDKLDMTLDLDLKAI